MNAQAAVSVELVEEDEASLRLRAEQLRSRIVALCNRLEREADNRVGTRRAIEERWLDDLRQYHGVYDGNLLKELAAAGKSQVFINMTRPKTNSCEARLFDMLFPTDDKNWGIKPTPVPELTAKAKEAAAKVASLVNQANAATETDPEQAQAIATQAQAAADIVHGLKAQMDEARDRATRMQDVLEDQLVECEYPPACRDAIRDACRMGTGILKGPIVAKSRPTWTTEVDAHGTSLTRLAFKPDPAPGFAYVDPWAFFPDPEARTIKESSDNFERHLYTAKQVRELQRLPGFDRDALRRVLRENPRHVTPTYLTNLRQITGETMTATNSRYQVWEYHGQVTTEEMFDLCACMGKAPEQLGIDGEPDPLEEMNVVLWFCQGEVLKFGIHQLDSGEGIYSVFNLERDESSVFGFGIPYVMRDPQKAYAGAWRMMLDNGGLSTGPQIEIDTSIVEPEDGNYGLTARKIWLRRPGANPGQPGLRTYNIEGHQAELANIINLASQAIDETSGISTIADGEQGTHTTQTAGGMSMLMNSVNVIFRRIVKNFDDDVTTPNIRRLYDWNMQFNERDDIKGDFAVDARGSSVLLVREMQTQNLMNVLLNMTGHPVLGLLIKAPAVLRKFFQSMMIAPDEIVKTEDEIKAEAERAAQQGQEPSELDMKKELLQMQLAGQKEIAQVQHETEMMRLAQQSNMKLEELRAMLERTRAQNDSKERLMAAEVAVTQTQPQGAPTAGGYI